MGFHFSREQPENFVQASTSRLKNQQPICLVAGLTAKMFDFGVVMIAQIVKTQAVPLRIHDLTQLRLQNPVLRSIQRAFKHGILYPLSIVHALPGNLTQPFASGGVFCIDIVCNDNEHTNLTSIETEDNLPDHLADSVPKAVPEYREPIPIPFSLLKKDG